MKIEEDALAERSTTAGEICPCITGKRKAVVLINEENGASMDGRLQSPIDCLSDDCLSYVFGFLGSSIDRNRCSLVCRRWFCVEGSSRHHLSLFGASKCKPKSVDDDDDDGDDLLANIPPLFARFNTVTTIALKSSSMRDDALALISIHCPILTCLKLDACVELTDAGITAFAVNCRGLKEFYCDSCNFGVEGVNAIVDHCSLEVLSVAFLVGLNKNDDDDDEDDNNIKKKKNKNNNCRPIGPGVAFHSLKTICIKDLDNGCQCFGQLIAAAASKNLRSLKISRCPGEWDKVFEEAMKSKASCLVEIHLQILSGISDVTLVAISKACLDLEILCLIDKTPTWTDAGLVSVADHCKLLRKLHIWRCYPGPPSRFYALGSESSDKALSAIAKRCLNLRELILHCCVPTCLSLGLLAANCQNLEHLALCFSLIGDAEISSIAAAQSNALRSLGIIGCPYVTNQGMKMLSCGGCPNLSNLVISSCRGVTDEGIDQLKADRPSLSISTSHCEVGHCPFWDTFRDYLTSDHKKIGLVN